MQTNNQIISFVKENRNKILTHHIKNEKVIWPFQFKNNEAKILAFLAINSPLHFAHFFKFSIAKIQELINQPAYTSYSIPKKKGGQRAIEAPNEELKELQRRINYYLQHYYLYFKPKNVNGFIIADYSSDIRSNIIENARPHVKAKYVLNLDIKDFFSSIDGNRVFKLFRSTLFDYSEESAMALTLLCTYKGMLPTGSPASPVISNFICLEMDASIHSFCALNNITYSRYADDLTFSSNTFFSEKLILEIKKIVEKANFKLNNKKIRLKSANRKQIVTGLVVNDKVNLNRKTIKLIRAILHDFKKNGLDIAVANHFKIKNEITNEMKLKFKNKLIGHIQFLKQVRGEDTLYQKFKCDLDELIKS